MTQAAIGSESHVFSETIAIGTDAESVQATFVTKLSTVPVLITHVHDH